MAAMALIEITTFRLAGGASDAGFVAADERMQTEFAYQQPGIVRRTTARGADGEWVVVTLWASAEAADAALAASASDPAAAAFAATLDTSSVRTARYEPFDR